VLFPCLLLCLLVLCKNWEIKAVSMHIALNVVKLYEIINDSEHEKIYMVM